MTRNNSETIAALKRLIAHPNTSTEERDAAKAALNRILGLSDALNSEVKKTKTSFASIFKKNMRSSFATKESPYEEYNPTDTKESDY